MSTYCSDSSNDDWEQEPCGSNDAEEPFPEITEKMAYSVYRNMSLGVALEESLDELLHRGKLPATLAEKIRLEFDKVMNHALETKVKGTVEFKAKLLKSYRFVDGVWTLILDDVEYADGYEKIRVDRVKVVALENRRPKPGSSTDKKPKNSRRRSKKKVKAKAKARAKAKNKKGKQKKGK